MGPELNPPEPSPDYEDGYYKGYEAGMREAIAEARAAARQTANYGGDHYRRDALFMFADELETKLKNRLARKGGGR